MTIDLESLAVNVKAQTDGDWVQIYELPGVEFRVRSLTYEPYRMQRQQLQEQFERRFESARLFPQSEWQPALGRLLHQTILLEWKGFNQPYSGTLALHLLTAPEYRQSFIDYVVGAANRVGQAHIRFVDETEKNSERPSATS